MKYILWLILFIMGCWPECQVDEIKWCHCKHNDYILECNDGWWDECDCYDNGGTGFSTQEEDKYFQDDCNDVDDCNWDEIKVPCTDICWRICPVGQQWDGTVCIGYSESLAYVTILDRCKALHKDYRFPTLKEFANVTNNCQPDTFNYMQTNYCSPYQTSALSHIIDPSWVHTFDVWLGEMEICTDNYNVEHEACAWIAKLYIKEVLDTEVNFLVAHGGYGSAMSSGMCVRRN